MMKNNFLLVVIFALLCSACGGGYHPPVKAAEATTPSSDNVERECSYFYFMWARTAELEGKFEEAREAYEKALVCDTHAVHIMRRLAVLLINMGQKDAAAAWIKTIIAEYPDDISSHTFLANLYVSMDEFAKAEKIYLGILRENPKDYDNMLVLGALYARQKKFEKARNILEKLVGLNPESAVAHHYLAKIYVETEEFEKARSSFERALELNWSSFLAFEAAFFLEKRGGYEEALKLYRQVAAEDEANERVRTMIVALLLKMERIDEAIVEMDELLGFAADPQRVELNLSRLLLDRKRYDEALVHLANILARDPNYSDVRILMAVAYHDKGDIASAKRILNEVGPEFGDYENATIFLTRIMVEEKKHGAAIALLMERISEQKTRRKIFYPALASLLQGQKRADEAGNVFREAMEIYPDDKELLLEYALFQDEKDDVDGALATMARVLAISPDEPYALNYLGYTWAERGEKLDMALEYVEKALELKPGDGFILDSVGWVLFKMGRFNEALEVLQKSIAIEGDDPAINEHIGDVYYALGQIDKAVSAWRKALPLQPEEEKKRMLRNKIEAINK
jgi:tetratricopeptide (TPR) repeat protein